ncbi:MAG: MBL fold metallo-hydrolase [Acidiferrobacter sp.]
MDCLLEWRERAIWLVEAGPPAVYYIADRDAGGVLINAPSFAPSLYEDLSAAAPLRYVFLPSHFGARDLGAWRAAGARVLVSTQEEGVADVDLRVGPQHKLTRTIDFIPIPGRTRGTCGLRLKNKPGALFLGPALTLAESGWPELVAFADDESYENRLMGVIGLRDQGFEYLFTDSFVSGRTRFGPGADAALRDHIDRLLA